VSLEKPNQVLIRFIFVVYLLSPHLIGNLTMAKTDFKMTVQFLKGEVLATTKTHMIDLRRLFDVGNRYRGDEDKPSLRMESWLALQPTKEFIQRVSDHIGRPALETKRGRNGSTWAHLLVALDAAMYLSPSMKLEVLDTFLNQRILDLRDDSANRFIDLNAALALAAEETFGKPTHRGHYTTIARIIRDRLGVTDWNLADAATLRERARIEETLTTMLKAGVVRDWDHLKELAEKV